MSLINQMLQELDARRATVTSADGYGQQVRAVPERSNLHPAWWLALALAIVLCGLLAWMLLRPSAPATALGRDTHLPLKVDPDISLTPILANSAPADEPAPAESVPVAATVVADAVHPVSHPSAPAPVAMQASLTALPAPVKTAVPVEAQASDTAPRPTEAPAQIAISKQVKELTQQQRAENDYRKSITLLQQGRAAEAGNGLEQALQLDPHHVAARQTLIGLLLDNRRADEALRIAREGLVLDSSQPGLAMILARLQLEKGELREAIETLERTLAPAAERADYQAFLAALLQRDERHKQAVEHYWLALQKAPQSGVWWMGLGISLHAEHRAAEAQDAFRRAKATNSLSPELLDFVDARLAQLAR